MTRTLIYVDSSVVVGHLFGEPAGRRIWKRLIRAGRVFSSALLQAEVAAAARREGEDPADALGITRPIEWVQPNRPLEAEVTAVLQCGHLRGADLWHVACALYLDGGTRELSFASLDSSQADVAKRAGLAVC